MPPTAAAVSEELTCAVKTLVKASPGLSIKERLRTLARHVGMPISRVQDYWYGEVRVPPAHEADLIRAYLKAAQELIQAKADHDALFSNFIQDHPRLAFLVPGPVKASRSEALGTSFAAHKAHKKQTCGEG